MSEKQDVALWTGLIWLKIGTNEGVLCNEISGSIKRWKILE
jgi:hypothetical protein